MPKQHPPEFRRKVLDLLAAGRRVAQIAADLDISDPTIYTRLGVPAGFLSFNPHLLCPAGGR
jgi:hypothetical protein